MRGLKLWLMACLALAASAHVAAAQDADLDTCRSRIKDDAVAACTRLISRPKLTPRQRVDALTLRAGAYRFKRDLDSAIADYDQAIQIDPKYAPSFNGRGYARLQKARYLYQSDQERFLVDSAVIDFQNGVRADPKFIPTYINLVDAYRVIGDLDEALKTCEQALKVDPNRGGIYYVRASVWRAKGDIDRAIADLRSAIRLNENAELAHNLLGGIYERRGDYANAKIEYRAALEAPVRNDYGPAGQENARKRLAAIAEMEKAAPSAETRSVAGTRVALVIGNSAYQAVPALINPKRDAAAIAEGLRRIGFQTVTLQNDLTRDSLVNALSAFSKVADHAEWALVYFAGHGMEMAGNNYLIPVDAKLETERALLFEAVPLDQVLASVEGAKQMRIVLLDACRDNPFAKQMRRSVATRSLSRGLSPVEPEAGMLVVFAAKHGQVALDGEQSNSPFVTALLKNLPRPGVEIRKFFDLVRDDVLDATNGQQQPFTYGSVPGRQDFFFVAR